MTNVEKIGGVDVTAPLWRKMDATYLHQIVELLSKASYSFASESSGEWGDGYTHVRSAAMMVNAVGLDYYAIQCLHRHKPQLVTLDQFMDVILKDARNDQR